MVETSYMPVANAERYIIRKTQWALWKDIVRYLAELVTNSDDSYNRLEEKKDQDIDWRIYISVFNRKKEKYWEISVTDFAEWMSYDKIKEIFTEYWNDNAFKWGKKHYW